MTEKAPANSEKAPANSQAAQLGSHPAAQSVSGTQLNLTTEELAELLDIKEAQRDRAHTLLEQAQAQLSAAKRELSEAEKGAAVMEALASRGVAVLATVA
jgi:hypothetical protein